MREYSFSIDSFLLEFGAACHAPGAEMGLKLSPGIEYPATVLVKWVSVRSALAGVGVKCLL